MKAEVGITDAAPRILERLRSPGLLLASCSVDGRPNVMTIGWGFIGVLWSRPVFAVWVRPSRYTHGLIKETREFTINVPRAGMERAVEYCGRVSGRDHDKFREAGLTPQRSVHVKPPVIRECSIHLECRVIYEQEVAKAGVRPEVASRWYPSGNFHTVFYGEILAAYADEDWRTA